MSDELSVSDIRLREHEEQIETLQETQRKHQEIIHTLRQRLADCDTETTSGANVLSRRGALQAGGLLGLLGVGVTGGAAESSGQIGTADRPLGTLHTTALDGPLAGDDGPITDASTAAEGGALALRDSHGGLAVGEATGEDHAVPRGQETVTWTGDHNFSEMPSVGGSPVVESDSDSNGHWTRWADGTQVCWKSDVELVYSGSRELRNTWTYAREFSGEPAVTTMLNYDFRYPGPDEIDRGHHSGRISQDSITLRERPVNDTYSGDDIAESSIIALGRW